LRKITKLKLEILKSGLTQKFIAEKARINEGLLSQISNGKLIPNKRQRQRIAVALGIHQEDLFEQTDG
jgi:transcriptional regulator with XRE-family HTH domain